MSRTAVVGYEDHDVARNFDPVERNVSRPVKRFKHSVDQLIRQDVPFRKRELVKIKIALSP